MKASRSVQAAAAKVAEVLLPHRSDIGERIWNHIAAARANLVTGAQTPLKLANAACHSTSTALLLGLANIAALDDIKPTTEVILATRALVQNGFSEDDVMSGYRVGTAYWCEIWADAVEEHNLEPRLAVRIVSYGTSFALGWLEMICSQVTSEYRDEAERLSREGSVVRAAYVRKALTDTHLDIKAASKDLRYDLSGRHVALVITRHPDSDNDAPLDSIARAIALRLTQSTPLIVRVDLDTTLCWIATRQIGSVSAIHEPVLIGLGRPAQGLHGFRRSHREATEAARVARLAGRPAGTVTRFDEVELVSLCSSDSESCRTFIVDNLGPLVEETDESRRLRDTLEAFFTHNCSYRATATHLGIHHNTVRYRLEKIGILLGRAPEEHRLHLELALHLAGQLGVLTPQPVSRT
jgi:hypothetical protein